METIAVKSRVALNMSGICKRFAGVQALDHVDLRVGEAEIHALLGENGAGKSTLMKILSGAYSKDEGTIELFSSPVEISSPKQAENTGISIIYQELNLIPGLSVAENIFLSRHKMANSLHIDWNGMYSEAEAILGELEVDIDPRTYVRNLRIAQQQMVEVAKALSLNAKIIIMDEPTAPLTDRETSNLFRMMRRLKQSGVTIIYISHRLEEVKRICDRATIMRDGKTITEIDVSDVSIDEIIKHMVGRDITEKFPKIDKHIGTEVFKVENLSSKKVTDVGFTVKAGEILGIGGLVGSGRTETARAVFGLDQRSDGKIYVDGRECDIRSPKDAIASGIGFVTEDRKDEGLVLKMSVGENITLASLRRFVRGFHLSLKDEREISHDFVDKLKIKTPSLNQLVRNLSGGNQQKVVLAKWILSECKVLILDEPTRGIDVGAKVEVYKIINTLAESGKAVIVISSEIPEMLGICDRIVVMSRGQVSGELPAAGTTQEEIMTLASGIKESKRGFVE